MTARPVPAAPGVAAFDFDGTLTDGGSVFEFLVAVAGRGPVYAAAAALSPRLVRAAMAGGTLADTTKERLFERVLAGVAVGRVEEAADRFAPQHLDRHRRPAVLARLEWHRRRGDRLLIVSASPEVYVRRAGVVLGVDDVIATRLAVADGLLTGRYDGANCRGEEKLRRLRQWVDDSAMTPGPLWAYGNSRGDLRMLRAADVGVNVGRLGRAGRLRAFPGLDASGVHGAPA